MYGNNVSLYVFYDRGCLDRSYKETQLYDPWLCKKSHKWIFFSCIKICYFTDTTQTPDYYAISVL